MGTGWMPEWAQDELLASGLSLAPGGQPAPAPAPATAPTAPPDGSGATTLQADPSTAALAGVLDAAATARRAQGQEQSPMTGAATGAAQTAVELPKPTMQTLGVTSTTQVTPGVPIAPGYLDAISESSRKQMEAIQAEARANEAAMRQRAFVRGLAQSAMDWHAEKAAEGQAKLEADIEKHSERYDELRKEALGKVDPNRWSRNLSTWSKLALVLAAAAEGFGAGLQGRSSNQVLAMIDNAIDRDIMAQKLDLANRRAAAAEERNALGMLRARLGDMRQAEAQYRQMAYQSLAQRLQAISDAAQSDAVKAQAQKAAALVQQAEAQAKAQAWAASQPRRVTSTTVRRGLVAPGGTGQAAGKPLPPAQIDAHASIVATLDDIGEAERHIRSLPDYMLSRYIPTSEAQRIRDLYIVPLLVSVAKSREKGVLTDADFKRYKNMLDRPLTDAKDLIRRLAVIKKQMVRRQATRLGSFARQGYAAQPLVQQLLRYYPRSARQR